ncbi:MULTISPECIES: flagellin [Thalassospira]|jgi:flagellin|nr:MULTISPECIES: flagellin [Thalassospira]MBL4841794.1 flagellin [Thalassospira sp.]MBR9781321.1 flagellin [Rhodospirillales bacterium]MBR9817564.1 flagellin [Rhodospirillales bacterium]OCK09946.1 flagellin domain protein [Thalassospira sp. KO164]PXX27995.1 flagellin [Thalassospira sp. 11-3]|tara:strand:- start:35589 stop:36407 length:819 start_codon:yes stop_codon:yes gene_type:complete
MASINTNMSATLAVSNLNKTTDEMTSVLTAMSSGKSINSASDDAAGLAVYTAMSVDYAAWEQAGDNAEVATAILETADGGLSEIGDILERMYELASEASSGSVTDTERAYLDSEYQELVAQVDSIVNSTTYFDTSLLDGTYNQNFTVSADSSVAAIAVDLSAQAYDAASLGLAGDLTSATNAATELTAIEAAVTTVSSGRATVGALMSRFDYASGNIETAQTNLEAAMSVYMDADIAELSAEQTELGVKMDSAIQALSVSNENLEKLSRLLS